MKKKETPMTLGKIKDKELDLKAIQFFLDKRDISKGGVQGWTTPFYFKETELAKILKCDLRRVRHIIERFSDEVVVLVMKHHTATVAYETNLIKCWSYNNKTKKIKVIECSTEKLKRYREMVLNDQFISQADYLTHEY